MQGETLLDKAIRNYNVAVMIDNQMDGDEAYLNFIGYHLQQAVEMCLKYQLEAAGIDYPKTHDIDQLIRIGKENGAPIIITDYVEEHSEMFSLWEARTRYVLNYGLEETKVKDAMREVGDMLDHVIEVEKQCDKSETEHQYNNGEPRDGDLEL